MVFGTITVDPTILDWVTFFVTLLSLTFLFCLRRGGPIEGHAIFGESHARLRILSANLMENRISLSAISVGVAVVCIAYQVWRYVTR